MEVANPTRVGGGPVSATDIAMAVRMLEAGWGARFTPETASLYLDGLADLDAAATVQAVRRLLRSEEFRPSVARVRREVEAADRGSVEEALAQAEALLGWRDSIRFVNGSGWTPERPVVASGVLAACEGLRLDYGWRERFLAAWRNASTTGALNRG